MEKRITVLARRDTSEAMRVAAGLTIFGHQVDLVLLSTDIDIQRYRDEFAELLELADIEPVAIQTIPHVEAHVISKDRLSNSIIDADTVLSL